MKKKKDEYEREKKTIIRIKNKMLLASKNLQPNDQKVFLFFFFWTKTNDIYITRKKIWLIKMMENFHN